MKKQSFRVTIRVNTEVESQRKPYLTEKHVMKQIQKFLDSHSITQGLPCHGTAEMKVTDVIETNG